MVSVGISGSADHLPVAGLQIIRLTQFFNKLTVALAGGDRRVCSSDGPSVAGPSHRHSFFNQRTPWHSFSIDSFLAKPTVARVRRLAL